MTMNRASHCLGRRDVGPVGKIAAVVLGLAILGYVADTQGEHPSPAPMAASVVAPESGEADARPAIEVLDAQWLTHLSPALDEKRGVIDDPRECRLDAGIDSACIFN
jgi:hypothetical protein